MRFAVLGGLWLLLCQVADAQTKLVGHWPLQGSVSDQSPNQSESIDTGIRFEADGPVKTLPKSAA